MAIVNKPGEPLKLAQLKPTVAGHTITCGQCGCNWTTEAKDFYLPHPIDKQTMGFMFKCPEVKCGMLVVFVPRPKSSIVAPPSGFKV